MAAITRRSPPASTRKYGIEVTLRQGGPQVNQPQLLAAGRLDFDDRVQFLHAAQLRQGTAFRWSRSPRFFQKDPAVLIAHQGVGNDSLAALKGKPIMIGADTPRRLVALPQGEVRLHRRPDPPYNFNIAPFLANKKAVQQGYLTSEPFLIEQAGAEPIVFLLADAGYASYGSIIETSQKLVDEKPDLVQRFVDASIEGWYSYLYGDPRPANALIKKDNPEETDELLAYAIAKMKEYGIVDSGDA